MTITSSIGHIYVALLDGGIVKTGKTKKPKARISKSGFGNRKVVDYWVSSEFVGYSDAESEMIRFLGEVGTVAFGREYFSGVDYSIAVERAKECFNSRSCSSISETRRLESLRTKHVVDRCYDGFYQKSTEQITGVRVKPHELPDGRVIIDKDEYISMLHAALEDAHNVLNETMALVVEYREMVGELLTDNTE